MKKLILLAIIAALILSSCATENAGVKAIQTDKVNQDAGVLQIVQNQPAPNLGGRSWARDVVIGALLKRNTAFTTWTYTKSMTGQITEICQSIGYPVPYSTQLTNPERVDWVNLSGPSGTYATLPNAEPDSLYYPESANATWITCTKPDGTSDVVYFEDNVFTLPWRIESDFKLTPIE